MLVKTDVVTIDVSVTRVLDVAEGLFLIATSASCCTCSAIVVFRWLLQSAQFGSLCGLSCCCF